jgi:hypothetical protein
LSTMRLVLVTPKSTTAKAHGPERSTCGWATAPSARTRSIVLIMGVDYRRAERHAASFVEDVRRGSIPSLVTLRTEASSETRPVRPARSLDTMEKDFGA